MIRVEIKIIAMADAFFFFFLQTEPLTKDTHFITGQKQVAVSFHQELY